MVYLKAENMFILKHNFAFESFAAISETFSSVFREKKVPNETTAHLLVIKFRDRRNICPWQMPSCDETPKIMVTNCNKVYGCNNSILPLVLSFCA
jgi:hypothetical protein